MPTPLTRRRFLSSLGGAALGTLSGRLVHAAANAKQRPNVILILADDLGWVDTSFTGSTFYRTPNIERLAKRGVFLPNAYSASPLCSPTRASIMTGQSPARVGITTPACHIGREILQAPVQPKAPPCEKHRQCVSATRLEREYYTLAEALRDAGYATGHFGKWHEYDVKLPLDHPLSQTRLDPCSGAGAIEIDWMRLSDANGNGVHEWTFAQ